MDLRHKLEKSDTQNLKWLRQKDNKNQNIETGFRGKKNDLKCKFSTNKESRTALLSHKNSFCMKA